MIRSSPAVRAYAMLALVMLMWAGNSITGRAVRDDVPPFTLALVRWAGALVILAPFAWAHVRADLATFARHWRITLALGVLGVGAFNALLYTGLHHTTATNGLLIQAAIPAVILLLNRLIFRDAAAWIQVVAVLISTLGVALIVMHGDLATITHMAFGFGDLLMLGAVAVWSLYTVLLRVKPPVHPLALIFATFVIGFLAMLPLAIGEWMDGQAVRWSLPVIGAFVYVATLPSLAAYILFNRAVETIGAGRAGQTITLMPLFGAFLAVVLLGEPLAAFHWWGMALIVAGIVVTAVSSARK